MNGSLALFGRVVLPETILQDGAVVLSDGLITYVGSRQGAPVADSERVTDGLIAPGFVDIHCHAGGRYWAYDCPEKAADFHLAHGTTAMLLTLYRDLGNDGILRGLDKIRGAMKSRNNILGAHLEGPYLNPKYGAISGGLPLRAESQSENTVSAHRQWQTS